MNYGGRDRRKNIRYDTGLEIQFRVNFDLKTRIMFRIVKNQDLARESPTYSAIGRNINVEGICFHSAQMLKPGDRLMMDVFLPSSKESIRMDGRVRWCRAYKPIAGHFETGVKVDRVKGEEVERTIGLDPVHKIRWSILLETVLGGFKEKILRDKKII